MTYGVSAIVGLFAMSLAGAALAESMTCGELVSHCTPGVDAPCMQTLSGVVATHGEICVPGLSWAAATGAFVHWAELNPASRGMPAWDCIVNFYTETFPCKK